MITENTVNLLCMGCMTIREREGFCPKCGFNEQRRASAPHQLPLRTILAGKYLVGKVLGEGGFGITYIGIDLNSEKKIAIKEYYPTGFVTRESATTTTVTPYAGEQGEFFTRGRTRFVDEAKNLVKFRLLPGIVSVSDFFSENGTAYIVMEYIDGRTFKDYAADMGGKLPAAQVFDMMRPVINSLAAVHRNNIIHRDISPDNIMISNAGYVKLLDFGAAKEYINSGNKSLSVMLKPGYAPEEQYRSKGTQGPWTDVYALSATMYKMITGVTPDESTERMRFDSVKRPSELGIQINRVQEAALMRGMAVLQENRFRTVDELVAAMYPSPVRNAPPPMPRPAPTTGQGQPPHPAPFVGPQPTPQPAPRPVPPSAPFAGPRPAPQPTPRPAPPPAPFAGMQPTPRPAPPPAPFSGPPPTPQPVPRPVPPSAPFAGPQPTPRPAPPPAAPFVGPGPVPTAQTAQKPPVADRIVDFVKTHKWILLGACACLILVVVIIAALSSGNAGGEEPSDELLASSLPALNESNYSLEHSPFPSSEVSLYDKVIESVGDRLGTEDYVLIDMEGYTAAENGVNFTVTDATLIKWTETENIFFIKMSISASAEYESLWIYDYNFLLLDEINVYLPEEIMIGDGEFLDVTDPMMYIDSTPEYVILTYTVDASSVDFAFVESNIFSGNAAGPLYIYIATDMESRELE